MELTKERKVNEVVTENYKAADVFHKHGIDFCCGGNITIEEACNQSNSGCEELIDELEQAINTKDFESDLIARLSLDQLIDHIVENHHAFVHANVAPIKQYLSKIAQVHGTNHPELHKVKALFEASAGDLTMHMQKEELVLFPYIKKLTVAVPRGEKPRGFGFKSVAEPIQAMHADHDIEGERFREIARLTDDYQLPEDGCSTYRVALEKLRDFESDLHRHIHLENNILFPRAIELEKKVLI